MDNDNKMQCKPAYKCAICGKEYTTVAERTACESACLKRQEIEAKKAAEAKKKEEQRARHDEVTKAIDGACALLNRYVKDYGHYSYNGENVNTLDDILPSKFLHNFLF